MNYDEIFDSFKSCYIGKEIKKEIIIDKLQGLNINKEIYNELNVKFNTFILDCLNNEIVYARESGFGTIFLIGCIITKFHNTIWNVLLIIDILSIITEYFKYKITNIIMDKLKK